MILVFMYVSEITMMRLKGYIVGDQICLRIRIKMWEPNTA